jgi:nitroreductase
MELNEAIYHRRAVRDYTSRAVDSPTIRELLNFAIQAPSAVNQQPWAFGVFQGKECLRRYSERAKAHLIAVPGAISELHPGTEPYADPNFNIFYNAGTVIVIYAGHSRLNPAEDSCLAAQNLMLAAYGLGLGTCPIGLARPWLDLPAVKAELGIPADYAAIFPVIIGYPTKWPDPTPRRAPVILSWK